VKLGHLRFIFKGQLSILLRLLEFVRNRELLKLSNKAIAENPHAQLGALLSSCAPLASRASVAHLRCALRDLTWVTLSHSQGIARINADSIACGTRKGPATNHKDNVQDLFSKIFHSPVTLGDIGISEERKELAMQA
jgi:hypothetical protein